MHSVFSKCQIAEACIVFSTHPVAHRAGWAALPCQVLTETSLPLSLCTWNECVARVLLCPSPIVCLCVCVFACVFCVPLCLFVDIPVWSHDVLFVCVSSEGKMVVLSLAIGLAEQDDFANLPDLQEAPASKENETTPEKR